MKETLVGKTAIFRNPLYPSLCGRKCLIVDDITELLVAEDMPVRYPLNVRFDGGPMIAAKAADLEIL